MKSAIYVLYQRKEFDKFKCFFAQFCDTLNRDFQLHVLINDTDCERLRKLVSCNPHVSIYCENVNLGVAGGRNYLIQQARAAGAEFLISCDSDIIFPIDYVSRLQGEYVQLQERDPDLGFVQPVLLNGPDVVQCFPELDVNSWATLAEVIKSSTSRQRGLWQTVCEVLGNKQAVKALYHTGVSNIWRAHFDPPFRTDRLVPGADEAFVQTFGTECATLRSEPEKLLRLMSSEKPVRVMSVAGGVTAFHVRALDRCGDYNDLFNPFAFEDSELGFCSTMCGLNNYLLTDLVAIHDIFLGNNNRSAMYEARIGVLRGAEIAGSQLSSEETDYVLGQSLFGTLRHMLARFMKATARRSYHQNIESQLPSFFLSYYFEFFRGVLDIVSQRGLRELPNPLPIFQLLRGFTNDPVTIKKLSVPLHGAILRADRADAKKVAGDTNIPIYALGLVNCRIEENVDNGKPLNSRYFDLYARLRSIGDGLYHLKADIQSDNVLHTAELTLARNLITAHQDGIISLKDFRILKKTHDYGNFSVEDIYPPPSLFKSTNWLPLVLNEIAHIRKITVNFKSTQLLLGKLEYYLTLSPSAVKEAPTIPSPSPTRIAIPVTQGVTGQQGQKRILIFTDSRGQHKPNGCSHDIFAERLAKDPRLDVDMFLCPMKWTTTLDFLEQFPHERLAKYDHVILFTGIVEWSPRPAPSAWADLYDNQTLSNMENLGLNTRDYSKKIVNNKKMIFDRVFGAEAMAQYLRQPFDTIYEGQKTINMYSCDMARMRLVPMLAAIPNLIFITANRFVPGWEGDFKRGRPANISITEIYSDLFANELRRMGVPLIDLRDWSLDEVKTYTCDNIHLTEGGSDYIFNKLSEIILADKNVLMNKGREILLIGNGPSSRALLEHGLENLPHHLDTFGCGAAYRLFDKLNWWPTYYAWCDVKVVMSHQDELRRISEDLSIPTKYFYFSLKVSNSKRMIEVPHGSTGDFLLREAINLGYKKIYLIGMEGSYTEKIIGSRSITADEYEALGLDSLRSKLANHLSKESGPKGLFFETIRIIDKTPLKNPNYFFEGYQLKGDIYSLPRSETHQNAWRKSANLAHKSGVTIINLSETSKIKSFPKANLTTTLFPQDRPFSNEFPIRDPKPTTTLHAKEARVMANVGQNKPIATAVIGVKFKEMEPERITNLVLVVDWIGKFYGDLINILIVEQDSSSKWDKHCGRFNHPIRHEFLYNPGSFNRGWGYNTAVRHFVETEVVCLMDSDILPGENFFREILKCFNGKSFISPYTFIHYTTPEEVSEIISENSVNIIKKANVQKPTTFSGGIIITRRETFNALKGFEQYIEYGGEDRALDVTIFNHIDDQDIYQAPFTYVHLYHPLGNEPRPRAIDLFRHLHENFGCQVSKTIGPRENIHKNCTHAKREKTLSMMLARARDFGDPELYRHGDPLAINGVRLAKPQMHQMNGVIFPPDFKGLTDYSTREVYANTPMPDSEELAQFYNRFQGQRCFIIGNGPSLNRHDLSLLENEYSFGVNSFYYKTRETGFRPTFYVVEDSSVMKENIEEIRAFEAPFKFFPTIYRNLHPKTPNTFFFNMNRGFYEKTSPNYVVPRFSTDASKVLYCGQSVTYINLQLAFFMGFTEVYLIGMDFDYVIPETHKRTGDVLLSDTEDPNHFHKNYFGKGKTWKDPKLDRVLLNYKMANLVYTAVGRQIFNATKGGKLEEFPRVDYDVLLAREPKKHIKFAPPSAQENIVSEISTTEFLSSPTNDRPLSLDFLNVATLEKSTTLGELNSMLRNGDYRTALAGYLKLYKQRPLQMYASNALFAARKLGMGKLASINDLLQILKSYS